MNLEANTVPVLPFHFAIKKVVGFRLATLAVAVPLVQVGPKRPIAGLFTAFSRPGGSKEKCYVQDRSFKGFLGEGSVSVNWIWVTWRDQSLSFASCSILMLESNAFGSIKEVFLGYGFMAFPGALCRTGSPHAELLRGERSAFPEMSAVATSIHCFDR